MKPNRKLKTWNDSDPLGKLKFLDSKSTNQEV